MMFDVSISRWLLIACTALLVGGCLSKETPDTHYYLLSALPGDTPTLRSTGAPPVLEIGTLALPQYLERPQFVSRPQANELKIDEFHRWGGNLRKHLAGVLAEDLSILLASPHVLVVPHFAQATVDYRVSVEVLAFEPVDAGRVNLVARWSLTGGRGGSPLAVRLSSLSRTLAIDAPIDRQIAAMSELVAELGQEIARVVIEQGG